MPIFKEYARLYPLIYKDKRYQDEARFVYHWAGNPKEILELGSGNGRHAIEWAKHAKVTGIERSKEMVALATKHPSITYYCQDICQYLTYNFGEGAAKRFPCVMAMFNVMGYCLLEECLPLLPLEKGGVFVFDVWDAEKFKTHPPQVRLKTFDEYYRVSVPEQISKRLLRIDFIVVKFHEIVAFERHFVQGYFNEDVERLCTKHGYRVEDRCRRSGDGEWTLWYKLVKV